MTDGEACSPGYHVEIQRSGIRIFIWEPRQIPTWKAFLRDRKIGRTYSFGNSYAGFAKTMLTHLKESFPDTNFIGIRVLASRDANYFISNNYRR